MSTELELGDRYACLQREREDGARAVSRGTALLVSAPVSVLVASPISSLLDTYTPLFITALYCVLAAAAGLSMMAVGAVQQRSARRRLDQLDSERLPEARLLR